MAKKSADELSHGAAAVVNETESLLFSPFWHNALI